jgi:hypothetical protein
MKNLRALALVLLCAGCRPASSPSVVAGVALTAYDGADGSYSCLAPGDWKALEDRAKGAGVMMFGTTDGPLRGKVTLGISRYPDGVDRIQTPQDYWRSLKLTRDNPAPLEAREIGGRTIYLTHYESPQHPAQGWKVEYMNRVDVALIPSTSGFFAVDHRAPADAYEQTLPIFDAVVASFKPKG